MYAYCDVLPESGNIGFGMYGYSWATASLNAFAQKPTFVGVSAVTARYRLFPRQQ
jgi:hypothetical protein